MEDDMQQAFDMMEEEASWTEEDSELKQGSLCYAYFTVLQNRLSEGSDI